MAARPAPQASRSTFPRASAARVKVGRAAVPTVRRSKGKVAPQRTKPTRERSQAILGAAAVGVGVVSDPAQRKKKKLDVKRPSDAVARSGKTPSDAVARSGKTLNARSAPVPEAVASAPLLTAAAPLTQLSHRKAPVVPSLAPKADQQIAKATGVLKLKLTMELDLAHIDSKPEVYNRPAPVKPPDVDKPFDQEAWLQRQQALTLAMSSAYDKHN